MRLTESWREVFPGELQDTYLFAETRGAAAILAATEPEAFEDLVEVLTNFSFDADKIFRPGGNQSAIAAELDRYFRVLGWREAKYSQQLTTQLTTFPWHGSDVEEGITEDEMISDAEGHKIDNVKGRAVVDIEWNPKDGNLDRDLANYVSLYAGGMIGVGVLLIRSGEVRGPAKDLIAEIRSFDDSIDPQVKTPNWLYRMDKTPPDPYGTSTTANFEKLVPRLQRGDGQGCPILAVGINWSRYVGPEENLGEEAVRLAGLTTPRVPATHQLKYTKRLQVEQDASAGEGLR